MAFDNCALSVPAGWHRVQAAGDGPVTDPRTLLVVGTAGVRSKPTHCQIAAYRVTIDGAVVVVVGCTVLFMVGAVLAYDPARGFMARRREAGGMT